MNSNAPKARVTEAVVPLAPAPSGAGIDVLAVTEDDFFLLAVRKVVTLPNRVWHATSDTQAADLLVSTPCAVALLDAELVQSHLRATIAKLRHQFPDLAFVVAGEAEAEAKIRPLIEHGEVQGFVVKQFAARRLAGGLQAGIDRHFELRAETAPQSARMAWKGTPALAGIAAGVVAAIALAATVIWFMVGRDQEAPGDQAASAAAAGPAVAEKSVAVEQTLQLAREAFEAGRYVSPGKNDDAQDHFRAALTIEPTNAEAKDGLSRIAEILLARTELALVEGNMRQANESLKAARAIEPSNPRISFLETQISREVARTATAQQEAERIEALNRRLEELSKTRSTQAAAPAANKTPAASTQAQQQRSTTEADRLLALGYERLTQGKLLQPAEDNSQHYLLKLKQLQPDHPSLEPAMTALREQLLTETESALSKNNASLARNMLDGARSVGAEGRRVEQLAADISHASLQAQLLTTPEVVQNSMIKRKVEPVYPTRARREGIEGYVDMRFIVSKQGEVKDVVVIGAQPQGYFEEEAVRTVKRWKMEPRKIDGEAYEQLLSLRLRFRLD